MIVLMSDKDVDDMTEAEKRGYLTQCGWQEYDEMWIHPTRPRVEMSARSACLVTRVNPTKYAASQPTKL